MKLLHFFMLLVGPILMVVSCGNPDNRSAADDSVDQARMVNDTSAMVNEDDAEFAIQAADAGLAEIELGKLAMERATDQRIKDFAQRMVSDHEKANDELLAIAAMHNITLPPVSGEDQIDKQRNLHEKSGEEFEREYMELMVDDHDDVVSLFEDASNDVRNADLQAFAAKTLPTLKKHAAEARSLRDSISPPDTVMMPRPVMP